MDSFPMVLVFIAIICSMWVVVGNWRRTRLPPGPWNLPIIGYLLWLDPIKPYITFTELTKKFGKIYGLYLGNVYTVIISDSKIIKKIFNKDAASGRAPLFLTHGIMQGYGLICAEGELWRDQRKFIHGVLRNFGATKVSANRAKMQELIMEQVKDFVKFIRDQGEKVNIFPLEPLRHNLGSAINQIVFGKSWSRKDPVWMWLQHLQEEGTKLIGIAGVINFLPFLRFLPQQRKNIEFIVSGQKQTHDLYQKFIEDEMKQFSEEDEPINLIQAFLKEKSRKLGTDMEKFYCDKQFYCLLADIFGASLDTTLTTLRWFLLYMAAYPEVQSKVRSKILELSGQNPVNLDDFNSLPYVEAAIAETQRIRSVVPVGIPHGSTADIEIDGYFIPQGSMIVPLQWAIHMDESIWKNPEIFDPERFIDENGRFVRPEHFIPFQTGKRMCVGDELARMFLYLFTSTILQNFEISCMEPIDLSGHCGITLTPKEQKLIFTAI